MIRRFECQPPREFPGTTVAEFSAHYATTHGHLANLPTVPDINSWRTAALAEVRRLAATGREWQMWQVTEAVGDPENHKSAMGAFAGEVEHLGLAHIVRYAKSTRPETKGSAVGVWLGGPAPHKREAHAA